MGRKGNTGGGGGGKDSIQAPPIDQYRKRIGRQDSKKEKKHLKEIKHQHEAKEGWVAAYQDSFLILVAVAAVFVAVYGILYFSIN